MLARLDVVLPFELTVPDGATYQLREFERDGYGIVFGVPSRTEKPKRSDAPQDIRLDGGPAFQADVITVMFSRESFDRRIASPTDPPEALIQQVLQSFAERLKYVTRAHQVKAVDFPLCQWGMQYLNDDGSELEEEEGLVRGRGGFEYKVDISGCGPTVWDWVFSLPRDFEPPAWHTLLIESRGVLPHVGTAMVLAATALEVLIAELLDRLVVGSPVPQDLWKWINDRGDWQKEPSVEDQYDVLLQSVCGHTLKEDNTLWEGLRNLRRARNSFVHEGLAKVGGSEVDERRALRLIDNADAIASAVREWIPEKHRWPVYLHNTELQVLFPLPGSDESPGTAESEGDTTPD